MKVIIMMIRNKEEVSSPGPMAENMTVSGSMESNTEKVSTTLQRAKLREANGEKERESDGSITNNEDHDSINLSYFYISTYI